MSDSIKVMLFEDNELTTMLLKGVLEEHAGMEFRHTANGLDAVNLAKSFLPHVALLDIYAGEYSGLTVAGMMKADVKLKHVKLVAFTLISGRKDVQKLLEGDFDFYLPKPVALDSLLNVVREAARQARVSRIPNI